MSGALAQSFAYTGIALKPYSPVHIAGTRDGIGIDIRRGKRFALADPRRAVDRQDRVDEIFRLERREAVAAGECVLPPAPQCAKGGGRERIASAFRRF